MSGVLVRDSPRLAALEASVERLRSLAVHDPFQQTTSPAAAAPSLPAHWKESLHIQVAQPNSEEYVIGATHDMADDADPMDLSSPLSPLSPVAHLTIPPSPTLPTRRLQHAPFRPSVSLPLRSESAGGAVAALSRLRDWSPPSSVPSSPGSSCRASASPFAFHSPYGNNWQQLQLQSQQQPLAHASHSPVEPFFPVVPLLQQSGSDGALLGVEMPSSLVTPPPPLPLPQQQQQSLTLTQAHLLQLAAPSASSTSSRAGWLTQSLPSSAASSCPPSPDLSRHAHGFPSSPSSHSHSSAECFALHTPDSPTWKPSTLAHQCGMDVSARRRAREAVRGRESVGRLKMIGLSSRAQHARQAQLLGGPVATVPSHAFLPQQHEGEYDSAGLSDLESTPSPLSTPTTLLRRQLQRTMLTHRIKPLMSSQGSFNMQTAMAAQVSLNAAAQALPSQGPQNGGDEGSSSSSSSGFCASVGASHSAFGATGSASPEVDPALVVHYLQYLSDDELAATLQPIRSLLPVDTGADVTALASPPSASAYSRAASSSSESSSASSLSSSSSGLHPPLSLHSVVSLSSLHLSLVWTRCLARSQWRSSLPTDLMHSAFAFLEPGTLLAAVMTVSKYWRNAANELVRGDPQWRAAVAAHRARLLQRCKMRVYRRLTVESLQQSQQREED